MRSRVALLVRNMRELKENHRVHKRAVHVIVTAIINEMFPRKVHGALVSVTKFVSSGPETRTDDDSRRGTARTCAFIWEAVNFATHEVRVMFTHCT